MTVSLSDISLECFSDLLKALYRGPLETVPWQDFLGLLRREFPVDGAILILRQPSNNDLGAIIRDGFPELPAGQNTLYSQKLYAIDPFINLPPGKVITLEEHVGMDTLLNSEFYTLSLKPFGIFHLLGVDFQSTDGLKASLRLSRTQQSPPFTDRDKALCEVLVSHLQQATQLHARINSIQSELSLYANAVGQLSVATLLLDEKSQILRCNATARQLLAEQDGIQIQAGKLLIDNDQSQQQLRRILGQALSAPRQQQPGVVDALSIQRPSGKQALGLVVRPVPRDEWSDGQASPTVAIFISDPEQKTQASQQVLAQLFELTPAEARLALLLADGASLDQAVASLSISRNTGRAHLRSIFSKTGINQQTQLVSLILKSVASFG